MNMSIKKCPKNIKIPNKVVKSVTSFAMASEMTSFNLM